MGELFQVDFLIGVAGCAGGLILGLKYPGQLAGAVSVTSEIVGVIIGAVIAGVSITAAFLDQAFLRKLRAIDRDPVRYIVPFLFTAFIGVIALLGLLVLSTVPATAPTYVLAPLGAVVGLFSCWAIASLIPGMGTLVQFVQLRQDALDVPDDVDVGPATRQLRSK